MNAPFSLDSNLDGARTQVESLLADRMARLASAGTPRRLHDSIGYSLLGGGKRLRPVLCLAFAEAVEPGASRRPVVQDAACALEAVHTYSLVHDDLPAMDDDDLRRGRPTNHKVYGEAMAILAGDALLTEAFGWVAGDGEAPRGRLCSELARAAGAVGMVGGQVLDIAEDRPATLDYLLRLHRLKTGALIRAACRMGVLAAGGNPAALAAAEAYGDGVGLAFQIADDILDVTSDATTLGKPTQADAAAGRHTFPAVVGLAESRRMADSFVRQALDAVRVLEPDPGPLAALARYSVERSS
ncbi:MAG: polyprenyl synthetase family protein [Myxococcaceae bacterium]|nr:polyprenyl synthetase family protein [Myxococcaceae bacterium]MCI0668965.1 polyprenyl synthetase family protein [Myxococcaceae bacterium]